jgi:D-hexose-6-phosphate mutarotase
VYTVTLHGEQLRTDLRVINTGDKPFEFTAALHSYIEVLGVDKAKVGGVNPVNPGLLTLIHLVDRERGALLCMSQ